MKGREGSAQLIRGGVYLVNFRPQDHNARFRKFILCLQEGEMVRNTNWFVGIALTTRRLEKHHPADVRISKEENATNRDAKAICSQIHTIPKRNIIELKYVLSQSTMDEIDQKLLFGIGLVPLENYY